MNSQNMTNTLRALIANRTVQLVLIAIALLIIVGVGAYYYTNNEPEPDRTGLVMNDRGEYVEYERMEPSGNTIETVFVCPDGASFTTSYDFGSNELTVVLEDRTEYALPQTPSAEGARYAAIDESVVYLEQEGAARLTINGETRYEGCTVGS